MVFYKKNQKNNAFNFTVRRNVTQGDSICLWLSHLPVDNLFEFVEHVRRMNESGNLAGTEV